ncbi:hypothetical protein F0L74_17485 [Chitinophaga agrisoli]|uniref:Uncharacterized protein n=1 Tax=Chitinophaga agrisoli TaxID=2607653 RepID=A0A5B2VSP7_9BACT|nr:hypothetical protein [Chitinophaga agrisoli]KAA2241670.1 hypothetical protein F0L74_17485 [Chitinophaga agrisoli]
MAKAELGLKQFLMGDIAADGGMGTDLLPLGPTVTDTAILTDAAPTTTDFNVEELDTPFYTQVTPGKSTVALSVYDVEPASLVRVLGGAASVDQSGNSVWEAPLEAPQIEQSIRLITQKNGIVDIPRGKVSAIKQFNFRKSALFQVDITIDILKPEKEGVSPVKYTKQA